MSNRYLPYGYEIRGGEIVVIKKEAEVIRRMYELRRDGRSLKQIAYMLNGEGIEYMNGKPWNKNNVARVLKNNNYLGNDKFPKIIEPEMLAASLAQSARVTDSYAPKKDNPKDKLWERLVCARCGKPVRRVGSRAASKGILILKCSNAECGMKTAATTEAELYTAVLRQMTADSEASPNAPEPSAELMRLQNEVGRYIERPNDTEQAKEANFALAAAKYALYERPRVPIMKTEETDRPYEIDRKSFARAVSHISIDEQCNLHICYTGGNEHDRNTSAAAAGDGDTRKSAGDRES